MSSSSKAFAAMLVAVIPTMTSAQTASQQLRPVNFPAKIGVQLPDVQHGIQELVPIATFAVEGSPDWMAVASDGIWITSSRANHVVWLDANTNRPGIIIDASKPCSGLALGFGSLWIPSCGTHSLLRVDARTGALQATIPASPADSEGGIATGAGSVWIVTKKDSTLARIDPKTNTVSASIRIPPGSFNPIFSAGYVWVSSNAEGTLVRIDPKTNKVIGETPVGPRPRFLTAGAGSIWVLNQGDGTVARVDEKTGKRIAIIDAGIPGTGGEIAFGENAVWATVMDFPITRIDPVTNAVTDQWHGPGGDSIRVAFDSIWLSNLKGAKAWRLPVATK